MPTTEVHSQLATDGPERQIAVAELAISRLGGSPLGERGFDSTDDKSDPFDSLKVSERYVGTVLMHCVVKHPAIDQSDRSMGNALREWNALPTESMIPRGTE